MMKNEVFALECRRRYAEDGLVVDASNGEFAHCPLPRGMGDTGYYLLHDDHQWQGLLQSEDVCRRCFFDGDARRFLEEGPFVEGWFELWDLYEKWCGNKGQCTYVCPVTGETALLTRERAEDLGWVGVNAGKSVFVDRKTGETALLTASEAEARGWVSIATGKASYRDPESGVIRLLTRDEAEEKGWVSARIGRTLYRNPETGECGILTKAEAEEKGWVGVTKGKTTYYDAETGEFHCLTQEEASQRGLEGFNKGKAAYRDPQTGKSALLTTNEAKVMGWVGVNEGRRYTQRRLVCPHCGKEGGASPMTRYHFDNCKHRQV